MNMKRIFAYLTILIIVLAPPSVAFALTLVPCMGDACKACNLVDLANNIINFLIVLAVLIAGILFAWAGFIMVTSAGNMSKVKKAKDIFVDVLIGVIIVLSGWIIINTIMSILVGDTLYGGSWKTIECVENGKITEPPPQPTSPTLTENPTTSGDSGVPITGPTMTAAEARQILSERGIAVNPGVNLEGVSSEMIDRIVATGNDMGRPLTITSARDGTHANTCHAAGTCLDVVCTSCGNNVSAIQGFINAAQQRGYCAVYEPGPSGPCPAGVSPCRAGVGTGAHYSFYNRSGSTDALCR